MSGSFCTLKCGHRVGIRLKEGQMKKLISISAIAAMIGLPLIAIAQTMPDLPGSVPAGTAVCRPVKAGETANASMGSTQMMCRSVDVVKVNATLTKLKSMKDKMDAPTKAQVESLEKTITYGENGGG
jgi:hypothetical protein